MLRFFLPTVPAGLALLLAGCAGSGFNGFLSNTFTTQGDQHRPETTSENITRANGKTPAVKPIATAGGNVWPGPIKPLPSLADIAKTLPQAEAEPALPVEPGTAPTPMVPAPLQRNPPPGLTTPEAGGAAAPALPPSVAATPSVPSGTVITTSKGQEKVSGGTGNFLTLTGPGGQYAGIMVPNGNGTSTIIRPGGGVETVPTPH